MKKILFLSLLGVIPFMTACGSNSNTMKCEINDDGTIAGYLFTFDSSDKLEKVSITEGIDFSTVNFKNLNCSSASDCLSRSDQFLEECKSDSRYENCKLDKSSSSMSITADYTEERLSQESSFKKGTAKEDVKKAAEDEGFTCK